MNRGEFAILISALISAFSCAVTFSFAIDLWLTNGAHNPLLFWVSVLGSFFGPVLLGRFLTKAEYLWDHE